MANRCVKPSRRCTRRAGTTLIEVLAGLALLAVLLVSLLVARARYLQQSHRAARHLEAVQAADALLGEWWQNPSRLPRQDSGDGIAGYANLRWQTRTVASSRMEQLGAQVVRLEIRDAAAVADSGAAATGGEVLASVEVLVPLPPPSAAGGAK